MLFRTGNLKLKNIVSNCNTSVNKVPPAKPGNFQSHNTGSTYNFVEKSSKNYMFQETGSIRLHNTGSTHSVDYNSKDMGGYGGENIKLNKIGTAKISLGTKNTKRNTDSTQTDNQNHHINKWIRCTESKKLNNTGSTHYVNENIILNKIGTSNNSMHTMCKNTSKNLECKNMKANLITVSACNINTNTRAAQGHLMQPKVNRTVKADIWCDCESCLYKSAERGFNGVNYQNIYPTVPHVNYRYRTGVGVETIKVDKRTSTPEWTSGYKQYMYNKPKANNSTHHPSFSNKMGTGTTPKSTSGLHSQEYHHGFRSVNHMNMDEFLKTENCWTDNTVRYNGKGQHHQAPPKVNVRRTEKVAHVRRERSFTMLSQYKQFYNVNNNTEKIGQNQNFRSAQQQSSMHERRQEHRQTYYQNTHSKSQTQCQTRGEKYKNSNIMTTSVASKYPQTSAWCNNNYVIQKPRSSYYTMQKPVVPQSAEVSLPCFRSLSAVAKFFNWIGRIFAFIKCQCSA